MKKQPALNPLKKSILLILCAFAGPTIANESPPSPFADSPLHFYTTYSGKGKPNLLLLLDDSGSMADKEFSGSQTRKIDALKKTVSELLNNPDSIQYNWGLEVLNGYQYNSSTRKNYLADLNQPLQTLNKNNRSKIINNINKLYALGGTPSTWRYYQTAMKLVNQMQYRCQPNHLILLSDGEPNHWFIKKNGIPRDLRGNPAPVFDPKFQNASTPMTYEDLMTSHDDSDTYEGDYRTVTGLNQEYSLAYFSRQFATMDLKSGGTDKEGGSWDDPAFPAQTITTHTIAFGEDVLSNSSAKAYLQNGATYGGGLYREAKNANDLINAFTDILNAKVKPFKGYSSVAPALVSTPAEGIAAIATLDSSDWSSRLNFVILDKSGNPLTDSNGNFRYQTALFGALNPNKKDQRRVLLAKRDNVDYFEDSHAHINNQDIAIHSNRPDEWAKTFIPWMTRYSTLSDKAIDKEAQENSGTNLRYRQRNESANNGRDMGDILDAPIVTMGKRSPQTANNHRFLVVAANDGMMHIFTAQNLNGLTQNSPSYHPYALKASYIPGGVWRNDKEDTILKNMKYQAHPQYGKDPKRKHVYLLNGGIASRTTDAQQADNRQTFLVANTGQGGKGSFALNIGGKNRKTGQPIGIDAGLDKLKTALPLWDTGSHAFGAAAQSSDLLGYTISTPAIARVATQWSNGSANLQEGVRYAAFIANGYEGKDERSALYIYDALGQEVGTNGAIEIEHNKGRLIKKIMVPVANENPSQKGKGLSEPTAVDVDFDGVADLVYAGDQTGNLYRFDLRGNVDSWHAKRIYQGSAKQPITAAPSVARRNEKGHYVILFGTGSEIYETDLHTKDKQSFYGIVDDINQHKEWKRNDLLTQTLRITHDKKGEIRHVSNHSITPTNGKKYGGWYVDLLSNDKPMGERVTTKAYVVGETVFFGTRTFQTNEANNNAICTSSGSSGFSWLMALNIANGGHLSHQNTRFSQQREGSFNYVGIRMSGIISSLRGAFSDNKTHDEEGLLGVHELTENGEFNSSGYSKKLGKKHNASAKASQSCGKPDGVNALFFTASDTGLGKVDLTLKDCMGGKRIAWREIF